MHTVQVVWLQHAPIVICIITFLLSEGFRYQRPSCFDGFRVEACELRAGLLSHSSRASSTAVRLPRRALWLATTACSLRCSTLAALVPCANLAITM